MNNKEVLPMRTTDISDKLQSKPIGKASKFLLMGAISALANYATAGLVDYNPDQVGTVANPVVGMAQNNSDFLLTHQTGYDCLSLNFDGNNQDTPKLGNPKPAEDSASYSDTHKLNLGTDKTLQKINLSDGNWNTFNGHNSLSLGANTFGVGYDASLNKAGFAKFDGSTMSFHTYDFGTDQIQDLGSLSFNSALYGTPTGLDFANVNGDLRMIVGTKDAPDGYAFNNYILDINALTGDIDQHAKFSGDTLKLEDIFYMDGRLATSYKNGSVGTVQVGDFQAIPEPATMSMIIGGGIGLLALRRLFTPDYKR